MAETGTQNNNYRNFKKKKTKKITKDYYTPSGNPEVLSKSIDEIEFSEKTKEILKRGNISTLSDLLKYRERELYRIQNFNKKNLSEVTNKIKSMGLSFRPEKIVQEEQKAIVINPDSKENRIRVLPNGRTDDRIRNNDRRKPFENPHVQKIKTESESRSTAYDSSAISGKKSERTTQMKEEKLSQDALIKFNKDNKFGFKDIKGKVVIPPLYDDAFNFKEGLACVEKGGLYGYIDRKNNLVIPCIYDLGMSFSEGFACVTMKDKSGYIDKQGNLVISCIYDAATAFSEGSARVKTDGKWGILTPDGKVKML